MDRHGLRFTPFHAAGALFLLAGLVVAFYHGLEQFDLVPRLGWVAWSHIHFVTVGGFTQLLFGMLPQLAARRLGQPRPPRWYTWVNFVGLNGAFLLLWYGRGWGHVWAFDIGLFAVWVLVAGLLVVLLRMGLRSDRAWNATYGLYLVSVFVFLWGITYAYGLFAHVWSVPGGWLGLREAHVHANAWGFLGLAAVGTLYDLVPRILETDIHSERMRDYSVVFFTLGIFPLITGPWLGLGRSVTATGLVLFATGYILYLANLVQTYRSASDRSGLALSLVTSQFWLLGPAMFAPFVLFGFEWVDTAFIEDGALHFFFVGWALPVAFGGLVLFARNLPCIREGRLGLAASADPTDLLPHGAVPDVISSWQVGLWNLGVLVVGVGFFYQDQSWAAFLFGPGYTVLAVLWAVEILQAVRIRWSLRRRARGEADAGGG